MIGRFLLIFIILLFISGCATDSTVVNNESSPKVINSSPPKDVSSPNQNKKDVTSANDLWERVRDGFDIPDPDLEIIDKHVQQLQANPEYVNRLLARSSYYLYYIIEEVEARDMPSELALLPFVESAFNPKAISPVKAAGMWQFMPATGKHFNLKQNMFKDERGDIVKSTRAALEYLQKLHDQFDDWQLALAAYNWGEGSVGRSIQRNQDANLSTDYWSINMPNETKNYVPKLLAYKRIIENPTKYGFQLPNVPNHPFFVEVPVLKDMDLIKAVELSEMTKDQFIALNPGFTKPFILKESNPTILLPYGKAEIFKSNLLKNKKPLSSWTAVKVEKTDTVEKIANLHNTTAANIRLINNIPKGMKIRSGSSVVIPKSTEHTEDVDREIAQNGSLNLEKEFIPVPVVMHCRGKKCIAVPSKLANYSTKSKSGLQKAVHSGSNKSSKRSPQKAGLNNPSVKKISSKVSSEKTVPSKKISTKKQVNSTNK